MNMIYYEGLNRIRSWVQWERVVSSTLVGGGWESGESRKVLVGFEAEP